jgi:hypothetical protein
MRERCLGGGGGGGVEQRCRHRECKLGLGRSFHISEVFEREQMLCLGLISWRTRGSAWLERAQHEEGHLGYWQGWPSDSGCIAKTQSGDQVVVPIFSRHGPDRGWQERERERYL